MFRQQEHKDYRQGRCDSFVCDVTADWAGAAPFPPSSLNIVTLIFVLSAIHPDNMHQVARNIFHHLQPGGQVFFRQEAAQLFSRYSTLIIFILVNLSSIPQSLQS